MYSKEEVFESTLEYFQGDSLAANVWINKYCLKDLVGNLLELNPDDMHKRLASEFARIESKYPNPLKESEIYNLLKGFKYIIPQGSPMEGIGNSNKFSTLSNCYVVSSPRDSYSGILTTEREMIELYKRRGGVGLSLDTLRPKDMPTSSVSEKSSGLVLFGERYSNATREVAQDGRRGALMETCRVDHPDIEYFIDAKMEQGKISGANMSVLISDDFMKAVENNEEYNCHWKGFAGEINEKKDAGKVWNKIVHNAWQSAEPGVIFWDTVLRESIPSCYGEEWKEKSTNPCCFSIDSRVDVITDSGIKDIRNVTSNDRVWLQNKNKFVKNSGYFNAGMAEVFKVEFSNGDILEITENHKLAKIKTKRVGTKVNKDNFSLIELKNLKIGDEIRIHNSESLSFGNLGNFDDGIILGWLSGDGCLSYKDKEDRYPSMILDFWKGEHDIVGIYKEAINKLGIDINPIKLVNKGNDIIRFCSSRLTNYYTNKFEENIWNFRNGKINMLYNGSEEFIRGYLSAYFSADGTVQDVVSQSRYNISVSSINKERLYQVQSLLLNFGIRSSIGLMRKQGSGRGEFKNSKDCFRLTITGISNIKKFKKYIGFLNKNKQNKLDHICNIDIEKEKSLSYTKIKSIVSLGEKEIGCIEVPEYNYFTANSIISGNSELPLCPYDSCRLLVLNLYSYVDNPFTSNAKFNFNLFREHVDYAQRLLDDLIDLEIEKIDRIIEKISNDNDKDDDKTIELNLWNKIKKKAIEGRRTGLGITAEGDMLAALGLTYGTEVAINFSENLHKILAIESYKSSIQMAKERGSFPIWNYDKEKSNPFIKRIIKGMSLREDESTYEMDDLLVISDYKQYGRRNIANLTIAPTGSVSILTQTTSGIEPVFKVSYKRRRKVTEKEKATFIDEVEDIWEEYNIFHHRFIDWFIININKLILDIPIIGVHDYKSALNWLSMLTEGDLRNIVKQSPYYKATSEDVDYLGKVEMQGRIQKWIDHSISVTVNMPKDVTEQMVSDVYMKAYKTGCKGLTVYRDGSRSGVLVSNDKKEEVFPEERPKEVACEINHLTIQGVKWVVLVGIWNGKPYEVFCLRDQEILKKYKTGRLIKVRSRVYDLQVDDDGTIHNIVGEFTNPLEGALTRQISLNLKHTPLEDIYLQLQKEGNISDFNKAISRVFKKYLKDKDLKSKCPECKSNLSMESGCVICKNCGYSECN